MNSTLSTFNTLTEVPLSKAPKPPIAPRALEQWLPNAPGACSQCVCVFTIHCCVCALGWVKCRGPISSMGHIILLFFLREI